MYMWTTARQYSADYTTLVISAWRNGFWSSEMEALRYEKPFSERRKPFLHIPTSVPSLS